MEMFFEVTRFGLAVPVGRNHPRALSLVEASTAARTSEEALRELWQRAMGRYLELGEGEEAATDRADGGGEVAAEGAGGGGEGAGDGVGREFGGGDEGGVEGRSEEEVLGSEAFRRYYYPNLEPRHWRVFVAMCAQRKLNWKARQVFPSVQPSLDGEGEVVMVIVSMEVLRARAHATGMHAGVSAPAYEFDEDGRLAAAKVVITKCVGGKDREFVGEARWDDYYGHLGPAPLKGENWADVIEARGDGPKPLKRPTNVGPLALRMPRMCLSTAAEARGLRMAFSAECSGMYAREEMARAELGGAEGGGGAGGARAKRRGGRGDEVGGGEGEREVAVVDDGAPTTLQSLRRDLVCRMEMSVEDADREIERARRRHPHLPDEEFCPVVWRAVRKRAGVVG